jgi:transcriptional regulator with XRE-family HTH domain
MSLESLDRKDRPLEPDVMAVALLRMIRGWSPQELAEAAGVGAKRLAEIEAGTRRLDRELCGRLLSALEADELSFLLLNLGAALARRFVTFGQRRAQPAPPGEGQP